MHATRWLAWIACQAGDSRDLSWWEIPTWVSQWKLHLARGLSLGLLAGAVAALAAGRVVGLANGHAASAVTVIIVGLVTGSGAIVVCELGSGLSFGAVIAVAADLASGSPAQSAPGFLLGFGIGFGFVLVAGCVYLLCLLWAIPVAASPSASVAGTYRSDLRTSVIAGLMTGVGGGTAAGIAAGIEFGPASGLEAAVVFGLGPGWQSGSAPPRPS